MAPSWDCEICVSYFKDYSSVNIQGSRVCIACVRKMFDKALEFEHEYPPTWSGSRLHPAMFSHIMSADFLERYQAKEIEYKTPPATRVYCQHKLIKTGSNGRVTTEPCGKFIGTRQRAAKPNISNILTLGRCLDCSHMTCMVCDEFHNDDTSIFKHECTGKSHANEERTLAFRGLKRGKDWQQCPNKSCERRVELSEACNHMVCPCGTGFCFVCGKQADGDAEHWTRRNGCPRYNQPGDDNAEYDDGSEYDEDEDEWQGLRTPGPYLGDDDDAGDEDPGGIRRLFEEDTNAEASLANVYNNAFPPPPPPPIALVRTTTTPALLPQIPEPFAPPLSPPVSEGAGPLNTPCISTLVASVAEPVGLSEDVVLGALAVPMVDRGLRTAQANVRALELALGMTDGTPEGNRHGLVINRPYLDSDSRPADALQTADSDEELDGLSDEGMQFLSRLT